MSEICRIEMLGGLRVLHAGRVIDRFQTQKTGALLAYLAMQGGKSVARETLAELLWPEGDPVAIRNRLNQAISSLRRQLHVPELGGALILLADHHTLAVNASLVETDVEQFARLVKQAETGGGKIDRLKVLREAEALYKGEFLAGYYEDWAQPHRLYYGDLYLRTLDHLIRQYSKQGEPDQAIEYSIKRLSLDPHDIRVHLELMELYVRADRPGSALRQYEELGRVLQADGEPVPPEAEALRKRAERAAKASPTTRLPKGSAKPERVSAEPVVTEAAGPIRLRRIPSMPNAFVGREEEISFISQKIAEGARLITVVGIGGSGKTRLAVEIGRIHQPKLGGNVAFVSFTGVESEEAFESEVGAAFGLTGSDVLEGIRSLGPLLLILDNVEHLDLSVPVMHLLDECPDFTILATSRRPIQNSREVIFAIPPLPVPKLEPATTLAEIAQNESVKLFVNRAQMARADFQLTERTAKSIVELCQRLEGLPLALELAAGWARALTPSQMLEQASERYDQLESRRRDILPRHRSMRAALEGSYWLLSRENQELFCRLGVIEGDFSREDATAATGRATADAVIADLLESGLLMDVGEGRLRMLETVRAFTCDHCSPALEHDTKWKLVEYCLSMLQTDRPIEAWAGAIEPIYPTFVSSMRFAHAQGDHAVSAKIAGYLAIFWEARSRMEEALALLDEIDAPNSESGCAVGACALFEWVTGNYAHSQDLARRAVDLLIPQGASDALSRARRVLALEAHRVGRYEEAIHILELIRRDAISRNRLTLLSQCLRATGNAQVELRQYEEAKASYLGAIDAARQIEDADEEGTGLINLANLALLEGHPIAAEEWINRAEERTLQANHTGHLASLYAIKARILVRLEKYREALEYTDRSLRLSQSNPLARWRAYLELVNYMTGIGNYREAARMFGFWEHYIGSFKAQWRGLEFDQAAQVQENIKARLGESEFAAQKLMGESLHQDEVIQVVAAAIAARPLSPPI